MQDLIQQGIYKTEVTLLSDLPASRKEKETIQNIVKVRDMVYIITCQKGKSAIRINLSQSILFWEEVEWDDRYKNMKLIAFEDSIITLGAQADYMNKKCNLFSLESKFAYMYNTTSGVWTQLPDMMEARSGASLVLFNGLICAVGGSVNFSAECLNITSKQWTYLPPMISARRNAASVELNGELYVIGGIDAYKIPVTFVNITTHHQHALTIVEKYNPNTHLWTSCANLSTGRSYHAVKAFNGKIFVAGGFSNLIEVYRPDKDKWCNVIARDLTSLAFQTRIIAV